MMLYQLFHYKVVRINMHMSHNLRIDLHIEEEKNPENCAVTRQVYSRDSCLTANTQSKFTCISTSET